MFNRRQLEQNCVRDYCKYSDTVAISCAIHNLSIEHPDIAKFVGIEHNLQNNDGKIITPDMVTTYDNDRKGLLFELKWSLPFQSDQLEEKLRELRKYTVHCSNWRTSSGNVDSQDLVLICHIDDVQRVVDMVKKLSPNAECDFFAKEGFAIWSWTITSPKMGERKEELRLFSAYGKTRNQKVEKLVMQAGGILFPEDVLTFLRFSFAFIKEKPPVQYTMTLLIQNVLSAFQQSSERELYDIHTDMIYERAKTFFASWREFDTETIQIKRKWIREALEMLYELGLCGKVLDKPDWWRIPIPTLRTRRPVQQVLCRKISKHYLAQLRKQKEKVAKIKPVRPKATEKDRRITEF